MLRVDFMQPLAFVRFKTKLFLEIFFKFLFKNQAF